MGEYRWSIHFTPSLVNTPSPGKMRFPLVSMSSRVVTMMYLWLSAKRTKNELFVRNQERLASSLHFFLPILQPDTDLRTNSLSSQQR